MFINEKERVIELNKEEMKSAHTFGTPEYKDLQQARRDYPGFVTVQKKTKTGKNDFAGLDMKTIKNYVEKNGTNEQKENFKLLSRKRVNEDSGEYVEAQSFFEIKKWFLNEFPEIKNARKEYREKIQKIYEEAVAKANNAA